MINFTPIVRGHFLSRLKEHVRYIDHADSVQQGVLVQLVEKAALTQIGRKYDFSTCRTYHDFASRVPLYSYEDIRPTVMRMMKGEKNLLWPGLVMNYAQSSGTSGGKSKYIPITTDSFKLNHYQGASDVMSHYMNLNPDSRIFAGKSLILGGSFANELKLDRGVRVGDLSANLIEYMNPLVNLVRVPSKKIALMEDWNVKLPALVEACMDEDITSLSGVPSWFMTVLKEVLKRKGKECIHDVWPNLEVFFHGGISFQPYREQYESMCDMSRMHFMNTYNASEGFFAVQTSWDTDAMMLLLDIGIFFEFIPIEDIHSTNPEVYPIWEIEAGKTYELVITACNGLWRYRIGDTVVVDQLNPVKIRIVGRTSSFINAFGEELMEYNADHAIAVAERATGAQVANYTAAPVYATQSQRGRHQWMVEFNKRPSSIEEFSFALDAALREVNSDYDAKRSGDIFIDGPLVCVVEKGNFDKWLATSGKLGGQRKIPRLSNDRHIVENLLNNQ